MLFIIQVVKYIIMKNIVNKSKFVHYGEDVKYFDKKQDIEKENNIICIGYSKRDWKTLISAFNNIDTDYKLVILGKKIESANDRIFSYDFLPLDQLIWQIQKAKIGILPLDDLNYSFGQMTFLQQGILKLPMIVSNSRSLRDYFVENETCIVFNSGNEKELKEKIENLILDEEKQKEMIALFDGVETEAGPANGKLIVSENIADQGGITAALTAAKDEKDVDLKAFFSQWAKIWRMKASKEFQQMLLSMDVHAPAKLRANIPPTNLEEFYETFDVKETDKMYRAPENRLKIW